MPGHYWRWWRYMVGSALWNAAGGTDKSPRQFPLPTRTIPPSYHSKPNLKITYIHTCMHTCIHIYIHAYTHRCMHTRIYAYNTYMHTYIHIFVHTYTLKYSHIY